jgi:hypothetical protein
MLLGSRSATDLPMATRSHRLGAGIGPSRGSRPPRGTAPQSARQGRRAKPRRRAEPSPISKMTLHAKSSRQAAGASSFSNEYARLKDGGRRDGHDFACQLIFRAHRVTFRRDVDGRSATGFQSEKTFRIALECAAWQLKPPQRPLRAFFAAKSAARRAGRAIVRRWSSRRRASRRRRASCWSRLPSGCRRSARRRAD